MAGTALRFPRVKDGWMVLHADLISGFAAAHAGAGSGDETTSGAGCGGVTVHRDDTATAAFSNEPPSDNRRATADAIDHRLIALTQAGLPLVPRPYHALAEAVGIEPAEVMARISGMLQRGIIRRIGAVPNHYRLGYAANGMSVWNVPDAVVAQHGKRIGALDFVSHCYRRPRHPPAWPYNLFAMVHGRDRAEVEEKVARIAVLLGDDDHGHTVLYSTRILKKTGLRIPV